MKPSEIKAAWLKAHLKKGELYSGIILGKNGAQDHHVILLPGDSEGITWAKAKEFAKKAGFPRPILHGMCTYGITCRGVLQTYADYDPSAFKQHAARFSSPVFPGETVTMELWKDGNVVSFEAKVKSRGVTVIKSGKTVLA